MARSARVNDEAAFVLHRYDWSESSLVLDVFSRGHGRVVLAAKGVKRPTSQYRPVLLPLQPLRLGWGGDGEVRTLKAAHWQGGHVMPTGDALLAGYYLNELLLRLLARDDPHPLLFDSYAEVVRGLAVGSEPQQALLRAFELVLLQQTGVLPQLDQEGASLAGLQPQVVYQLVPELGLRAAPAGEAGLSGLQWQRVQAALPAQGGALAPLVQALADAQTTLRPQRRALLHYHSGVRVFQTRQVLLDVQRLAASP